MIDVLTFQWDMRDESNTLSKQDFTFAIQKVGKSGKFYYNKGKEQTISILVLPNEILVNYVFFAENSIDDSAKYQTHVLQFVYPRDEWEQLQKKFKEETLFDFE